MPTLGRSCLAVATMLTLGLADVWANAVGGGPTGRVDTTRAAGTPRWKARAPTNTARATTARKASPTRLVVERRRATEGDATGATPRFGGHPECAQHRQMVERLSLWWLAIRDLRWRRVALATLVALLGVVAVPPLRRAAPA